MQRPSSTGAHAQGSKRARASFEQRAERAMHSSSGNGAGEAGVPNSALLGLASMCTGAGDGRRSSLCADRVPPTPRASWKAACPFLAQLASFAEQEKEGSEVMSSTGHEHAVSTPPATKLHDNKASVPATPFATANLPPSTLAATQNSCSNRRKSVARRTLTERANSADIQQQGQQQQQQQAQQQHQQQQEQQAQQQWQGAISATPSSADVLRSNKQLAQQQHAVAAQHWAAACTSLALDSFLEPRLAIRAPRPRVHTGLSPEDCFPPSMTVRLHSCDRQPRTSMDTPSSLLASQLQACLSSLDAGLQQTADLQGRSPRSCFLSPRTPAACATPSQRCTARLPSEDLESCYNSSNKQQLCK